MESVTHPIGQRQADPACGPQGCVPPPSMGSSGGSLPAVSGPRRTEPSHHHMPTQACRLHPRLSQPAKEETRLWMSPPLFSRHTFQWSASILAGSQQGPAAHIRPRPTNPCMWVLHMLFRGRCQDPGPKAQKRNCSIDRVPGCPGLENRSLRGENVGKHSCWG